ncbi:metallophosphoesterase [Allosphingosinicella deserti]|uniref:Phosphodiesterase n=1 Tax=Allosphingosinicella deserti TaxID=2116704 RepID=A0A2P7QZD6_9SPHN|nr:metallophosphoesterase [Sphingomonas deserti]PSJ43319.1 phosphodiesterase [Sphingomonas deserti]
MFIAQISDPHLHADAAHPNNQRFLSVIEHLNTLEPRPDRLVVTGDLTDDGAEPSYRLLRKALERCPFPAHLTIGNHDARATFLEVFPDVPATDGFVQSRIALGGLHLILLDTNSPDREGGSYCSVRADWLRRELAELGTEPVLIMMHHPPCDIGIPWIDPGSSAEWAMRIRSALGQSSIVALCTGHVHLGGVFRWQGTPVLTCPSSASDLSLGFAPMQRGVPDGRPLVEQGAPGFALHRWSGDALATYFGRCPERVLAVWDEATRTIIDRMLEEASA